MKKTIAAAVAVLSTLAIFPAAAQDAKWYVHGAIGQSKYDLGGINADDKDTSLGIAGGYRFNQNVALEAGYLDMGKISAFGAEGSARGPQASLILSSPFVGDAFSVYGRLGVSNTKRSIRYGSLNVSDRKAEALYGLGLAYHFNKQVAATLEYKKLDDSEVDAIGLGVKFSF